MYRDKYMLDILNPVVPEEKLHPNFKSLLRNPYHHETLLTIQEWTQGFVDRDRKIVKEFQTTFNSAFWEFYLNAVFLQLGFSIDYTKSRPDFILTKDSYCFTAEAAIASHPFGSQPEWIRDLSQVEITEKYLYELNQLAMIRIANSIYTKWEKFCKEYTTLSHVQNKPFIICIAPFEQPFFYAQGSRAIQSVLYKFDKPLFVPNFIGGINIIGEQYIDKVIKGNGTDLELGFFTNDKMKDVSAIIFTNTATITKVQALKSYKYPNTVFSAIRYNEHKFSFPHVIVKQGETYHESLTDGLHIFINPFAKNKLNLNLFSCLDITFHNYDIENKIPVTFIKDRALIAHQCFNMLIKKDGDKPCQSVIKNINFDKKIHRWKDDVLYELNATVGLGINNNIAHYKNWTIVVFQDIVDKDWAAIAKPISVYDIQSFLLYNKFSIGIDKFFPNKEKAYASIKKKIDRIIT